MAAAVVGGEVGAVGADGNAADTIREPQVEQWLLSFRREMRARPCLAAIDRVENGFVVANGPAILGVGEENGGEHDARRNAFRLPPTDPTIVGEQYVTTFTDRDQPLAGNRQIEQQ
jgi:hypothetical protein